jgi:type III restriction enzyme
MKFVISGPTKMKTLKFEIEELEYQTKAVRSISEVLRDLENNKEYINKRSDLSIYPNFDGDVETEYWDNLRESLHEVQRENEISIQENLPILNPNRDPSFGSVLDLAGEEEYQYPEFTIEMETGTGKTYVYLRTMFELNRRYGFTKFMIVVPSIAIFEGVKHSIELSKEYFKSIYGVQEPKILYYGQGKDTTTPLIRYAEDPNFSIILITYQSFNSKDRKIYSRGDKPYEYFPYQYLQKVKPILILDEPQKMEGEATQKGIATLHPLFTLRFSATHRREPNPVYRLTPIQSFRERLVKRIQTIGLEEINMDVGTDIELISINKNGNNLLATLRMNSLVEGNIKPFEFRLRKGDNLYTYSNREEHKKGYQISEISNVKNDKFIKLSNGIVLHIEQGVSQFREQIFRFQIRETIREHIEKQEFLYDKGIKVLSLFFVDRVSNYINNGIIQKLFKEEFDKLKVSSTYFKKMSADEVQGSYFSEYNDIDNLDPLSDKKEIREMCDKIMKGKEKLVSFQDPVSFIFSHSAIREGWDNPNVFQICTLRNSNTEINRRQEIGRGLRLCVNQKGIRIREDFDRINVLTVIANESYSQFADKLQQEYREAGYGDSEIPDKVIPGRKAVVKYNEKVIKDSLFKRFWDRVNKNAKYTIKFNDKELKEKLVLELNKELDKLNFIPSQINIQRSKLKFVGCKITLKEFSGDAGAKFIIEFEDSDYNFSEEKIYRGGRNKSRLDIRGGDKYELNKILKKYNILSLHPDLGEVRFTNGFIMYKDVPHEINPALIASEVDTEVEKFNYVAPTFNFLERGSQDLKLSKMFLFEVFNSLKETNQKKFFIKPEFFYYHFKKIIQYETKMHIAQNIEYEVIEGEVIFDTHATFKEKSQHYPQAKIDENFKSTKYFQDALVYDSEVEKAFAETLKNDKTVLCFFKIPNDYKIRVPKIIGETYNPDWGIIRKSEKDQIIMEFVRETKGSENIEQLRFDHEKFKIFCGSAFFKEIEVNYGVVSPNNMKEWIDATFHHRSMH